MLARRLDDPDLEIAALSRMGLAMITLGQVDEGLAHLDQAMAAATGEEAATFEAVARTCCSLVMACDLAGDDDRVRQWGKVVEGYVHRHNELRLLTFCPTCEADLLRSGRSARRVRGRAGARPRRAGRHGPTIPLRRSRRAVVAAALAQGRVEEAEEALVGYGGSPTAVRADAAIRLARGEPAAAVALLERQLSLISRSGLLAVPLLAQLVEAQLANGDTSACAGDRGGVGGRGRGDGQCARHRPRHGGCRPGGAVHRSRGRRANSSSGAWRCSTGCACRTRRRAPGSSSQRRCAARKDVLAVVEAQAALKTFERLGARNERRSCRGDAARPGGPRAHRAKDVGLLTEREQEVLHLLAQGLTNREIGRPALPERQDRRAPRRCRAAQARRADPHRSGRRPVPGQGRRIGDIPDPPRSLGAQPPRISPEGGGHEGRHPHPSPSATSRSRARSSATAPR